MHMLNLMICSQQMLKDIKDETQNPDNKDYGMHVTVLMSHGGTFGAHGVLYGTDVKPVKLLDVFDLLSSENFKHMAGKPKVVIVVACRSAATDALIKRVEAESGESSTRQETQLEAQKETQQTTSRRNNLNVDDLLILQSCFDGRNSIRDANHGSPFIRELVKTLYKHSSHRDLVTLFDIVQKRVKKVTKKISETRSEFSEQVPVMTKTLTDMRKIFLFPRYKISPPAE
ncbi:CASP3 [Bugula neritina]|uniref:CASP3 n=1 Tax=Bugula neritina TaxID=10212 RepID=A0A7J7KJP4_BUGNE|nr:CASP3 [Bugula neritina]